MNTVHRRRARLLVATCSFFCVLMAAPALLAGTTQGVKPLNEAQKAAVNVLALSDAEHAALTESARQALGSRLAAELRKTVQRAPPGEPSPTSLPAVLAIGLPGSWPADRVQELPLLVATRSTGLRNWQVNSQLNLHLRVTSLDSGQTWIQRLGGTAKRVREPLPSMSGAPPVAEAASAYGSRVWRFTQVLAGLRDAWPAGRYAVTVLNFDWVSNTALLTLNGAGAAANPAPLAPGPALTAERDEVPPGAGLRFQVPAHVAAGAALPVQVVLRLPGKQLVLRARQGAADERLLQGTLLLAGRDLETPVQIPLAVPVRSSDGQPEVAKVFAFDARSAARGALVPGAYQAYLVFGEFISGPMPVGID